MELVRSAPKALDKNVAHFVAHLERPRDLANVLECFETTYAEHTGELLMSSDFFALYRGGEIDGLFGMAWANYYEAFLASTECSAPLAPACDLALTLPRVFA